MRNISFVACLPSAIGDQHHEPPPPVRPHTDSVAHVEGETNTPVSSCVWSLGLRLHLLGALIQYSLSAFLTHFGGPRGSSGEISRGNGRESRAGGESLVSSRVRMPVSFPGSWFQILDEILGDMINKR